MSAPVTAVTGLPGNGKTLYTICMVKEWAERENRQVYYHGIEILDPVALPWVEFDDGKTWHTLPHGCIIVIDEAHKLFPVRPQGSKVPPHVEAIAELRHQGHNLVLITQHPMELDSAIRRRVGRHLHAVRRFGMQACAVFEWSRCVENCDKTRKDAIRHEWVYNTKAYAWYKSAEIHTIKRRIPKKVFFLVLVPILLAFAVWYVFSIFTKQRGGVPSPSPPSVSASGVGASRGRVAMTGGSDLTTWHSEQVPRVVGLAHTAPVYDAVTKPVRAPYPAACASTKTRCTCFTSQATRLVVPDDLCRRIVDEGIFLAWELEGDKKASGSPSSSGGSVAAAAAAPSSTLERFEPAVVAAVSGTPSVQHALPVRSVRPPSPSPPSDSSAGGAPAAPAAVPDGAALSSFRGAR